MHMRPALSLIPLAWLALIVPAQGQPAPKGRVSDVPDDVRQAVIDRLSKTFLYPQLVIWKFDFAQPYPTGGTSIWGPTTTRAPRPDGRIVQANIGAARQNEDPGGADATGYQVACGDG